MLACVVATRACGAPSVGWCVGVIKEANSDRRYKLDGEVVNFYVHYEIDDNKHLPPRALARHVWRRGCQLVGAAGGTRVGTDSLCHLYGGH